MRARPIIGGAPARQNKGERPLRTVIVRYKVKADRLDEHLGLMRGVFDELARTRPAGLRYGAARAADGLSFTHIAAIDGPGNPLAALPAFQAFVRAVAERCDEPPATTEVSVAGDYGLFGASAP